MRQYYNTEYNKKRLKDKELFRTVQLQTWFREKRARYWEVDETRLSRDINNSNSSSSDDASAAIKAEIVEWMIKEEG
jgi:hypothetical protein